MKMHYPFEPIPLEYEFNGLEPYIDERTVKIHYENHYGSYIAKLNKLLEPYPKYHNWPLEMLITHNKLLPCEIQKDVYNNAGGVYNHAFYFSMLTPFSPYNRYPKGRLMSAILKCFGSFEEFRNKLITESQSVFGSGYGWLLFEPNGKLKINKTSNQDTDFRLFGEKLLNIDVWEHAYYLQYTYKRKEYLENIFNIINWDKAEKFYSDYLESELI